MTNEMMIGISAFVMGMCGFVFAIVSHNRMNKRINTLDRVTCDELSFMSERLSDQRYQLSFINEELDTINEELDTINRKLIVKKKVSKK